MQRTQWETLQTDNGTLLYRVETPVGLWLLDRWFRLPDAIFDWIEWRLPLSAPISRLPCELYSRWFTELVMRQVWTEHSRSSGSTPSVSTADPLTPDSFQT